MIVSLAKVKRSLQPDYGGDLDDTLISELITGVTSMAETIAGLYISYDEYTETFDGNEDQTVIPVKGINIWEITEIKFSDVSKSLTNFKIHNREVGVYYTGKYPDGTQNIEISYKAGYDEDETGKEAPEGLQRAIINEVVLQYDYLKSQSKEGENMVDVKKDFLNGESRKYFERLRRYN